jgi:hypothetical protein
MILRMNDFCNCARNYCSLRSITLFAGKCRDVLFHDRGMALGQVIEPPEDEAWSGITLPFSSPQL